MDKDYRVFIGFSTWDDSDDSVDKMKAICFNGVVLVNHQVGCGLLGPGAGGEITRNSKCRHGWQEKVNKEDDYMGRRMQVQKRLFLFFG